MTKICARLALIFFLANLTPLHAHEFWLAPVSTALTVGDTAELTLHVGEFFEGDLVGFSAAQTVSLRQYSADGSKDLRALLSPSTAQRALTLPLAKTGSYLVAFESQPNSITLTADSFNAYLHDEGLDFIKTRRETAGTGKAPARERYRRYVKTLLRVGQAPASARGSALAIKDKTYAVRAGHRLEIMPLADPLAMSPGDALRVRVLFEDKPLAGALVKAWHKRAGQTLIIRATSASDGSVSYNLPYAGAWMLSVVHMIPAIGEKDLDWDSLWGNLTFSMPSKGAR